MTFHKQIARIEGDLFMKLIKSYQYTPVTAVPFEIPFPTYFELYYDDMKLASYKILNEDSIDYSYSQNVKVPIFTPEKNNISINDIYLLLTIRVFPMNAPYAAFELQQLDLQEYNPYQIALKTHGVMQNDRYWLKFPDHDDISSYYEAAEHFAQLHQPKENDNNDEV